MTEFTRIYEQNYPIVYKYVLSLCRNAPLAEEITQEAFVKALKHMDRFDGKCQLYVWICQIAKNIYFTYRKKQKRFVSDYPSPSGQTQVRKSDFSTGTPRTESIRFSISSPSLASEFFGRSACPPGKCKTVSSANPFFGVWALSSPDGHYMVLTLF